MTDNIERVRAMLVDAGYLQVANFQLDGGRAGSLECYGGHGPMIYIHIMGKPGKEGFDVFAPVTDSAKVDDTLRALVERIAKAKP
jgi:hypothetical protein